MVYKLNEKQMGMKYLKLYFFSLILLANVISAQSNIDNEQIISMLKRFYTANSDLWLNSEPDNFQTRLDSLQEEYCSEKVRTIAKEWFKNGHDYFTKDLDIDTENVINPNVFKDSLRENNYLVKFFIDSYVSVPNKVIKKEVTLHVTLIKNDGRYWIDKVWENEDENK